MAIANAPSQFLLYNNLHIKPISARMAVGVLDVSTMLANQIDENAWHGHVVEFLSKTVCILGAAVTGTCAVIETLAATAIGGVGLLLCFAFRCDFLEKYTLKAFSYAVHNLALFVASIVALVATNISHSHVQNILIDHIGYVGSAILVQNIGGNYFDWCRGVEGDRTTFAAQRTSSVILEDLPFFMGDLVQSGFRDLDLNNIGQHIFNSIDNLNNQGAMQDGVLANLTPLLQNFGQVVNGQNGGQQLELNRGPQQLQDYQGHLRRYVEASVTEIYQDDQWVSAFADTDAEDAVQSGKDNLNVVDAASYSRIAKWAQLKELEEDEVRCPEHFNDTAAFVPLNQRRMNIEAAKALYAALNDEEKTILKHKLLRGGDYLQQGITVNNDQEAKVHEVYLAMTDLSASFVQGALVTRTALNINALDQANGAQLVDTTNIFISAFRNGLAVVAIPD